MTNRPSITQENILLGAEKAAENIIYFDKVEANITKLTNELADVYNNNNGDLSSMSQNIIKLFGNIDEEKGMFIANDILEQIDAEHTALLRKWFKESYNGKVYYPKDVITLKYGIKYTILYTDRIHMRYAIQPASGEIYINWVDFEDVPGQET